MKKAIIGKKLGMSQVFLPDGRLVPVTVVEAGPCKIVQKKTVDRDGYEALQVGFGDVAKRLVNKPVTGHYAKAGVDVCRVLKELKLDDCSAYEVGQEIKADVFESGDKVDVVGLTRGRGFTGVVQRWNTSRGRMTHGAGYPHRAVGSMSAHTDPSRVFKNKKMPGHYGHERVTVQNLEIVRVDAERNLLLVKGAVPGPNGNVLFIRSTVK